MIPQLNEKEERILSLLVHDPNVGVSDLAKTLDVSTVTMRGYLNGLSEKGYVYRVRGGAVPTLHPDIIDRQRRMSEQKTAIARYAASLVADGDTIMIEAGTTTATIVRFLLGTRDVSIVTNNTLALAHARGNPGLRVHIVGGEYRPAAESVVGPVALETLEQFRVKLAFVGTDGFSIEHGLSTHLVDGAAVVRRMADQAERVVALADSSKYGKTGFVHVLPLRDIDLIVTDTGLNEETVAGLEETGVRIVRVDSGA